jgi:hypothetical protein
MDRIKAALPEGATIVYSLDSFDGSVETAAVRFPASLDLPRYAVVQSDGRRWRYQWFATNAAGGADGLDEWWLAFIDPGRARGDGRFANRTWSEWSLSPPWDRL